MHLYGNTEFSQLFPCVEFLGETKRQQEAIRAERAAEVELEEAEIMREVRGYMPTQSAVRLWT